MIKNIFLIFVTTLILAYLSFAVYYSNLYMERTSMCKDIRVNIADAAERQYLNEKDILYSISKAGLSPVGKDLSFVSMAALENIITENRLIKQADCYKAVNRTVQINVYQRKPVLRIFSAKESYYIDSDGEKMSIPENFSAYVPVANGFIEEEYAQKQLYEFAMFLQVDKFWNSQIKQIYIAQNGDIELTPVVGNHIIILGKIDNYKEKLNKLRLFYDKGLSKVGWNRYSVINLKYKNQVVCTM